ncbi:MAG: hypothetical protein R2860_10000 [Desulfobacterales bacterium]
MKTQDHYLSVHHGRFYRNLLVSKGADIATIANLIAKEMDPRQIGLLNAAC